MRLFLFIASRHRWLNRDLFAFFDVSFVAFATLFIEIKHRARENLAEAISPGGISALEAFGIPVDLRVHRPQNPWLVRVYRGSLMSLVVRVGFEELFVCRLFRVYRHEEVLREVLSRILTQLTVIVLRVGRSY